ncbi:MAG: hypothetical protein IPM69_06190 [Ignavibacteria bacterium]|nr:hypothetical protein [Ignavibacteria bacterium]
MKQKAFYLLVIFVCALLSCHAFKHPLISFRDPAFSTVTYGRIMVLVDIPQWQDGYRIEERFVELLEDNGVRALSAMKFMPPTRTWTDAQRDQVIQTNAIDGILRISIASEGKDIRQVPLETTTTYKKEKEVNRKGDTVLVDRRITQTEGGYTAEIPWRQYDIKMVDAASGKTSWITSTSDKRPLETSVVDALVHDNMLK